MTDDKPQDRTTSKPNQPLAASLPIFDGLNGIDEARDVQARGQTTLEKLLEMETQFIGSCTEDIFVALQYSPLDETSIFRRSPIFRRLFPEFERRFADIDFSEADLTGYIDSKLFDSDYQLDVLKARGLYTGFLLDLLTRRYEKQGKKAVVHIDGKGGRFDHLFHLAQNIHELYLENFNSDYICSCIGYNGNIGKLMMRNISGRDPCKTIGAKGKADTIICAGFREAVFPFRNLFEDGHCSTMILSNIKGRILIAPEDDMPPSYNLLILDNYSNQDFLKNKLGIGTAGLIFLNNINLNSSKKIIQAGIQPEDSSLSLPYCTLDGDEINTILFNKVPKDLADYLNSMMGVSAQEVYSPPEPEYKQRMEKYKLNEIQALLKRFRKGEDMIKCMKEFDRIYSSVEQQICELSRR
ncbi:hypothetical protein J4434_03730 [Candidatus Woesearchaeota archaeon]|nr:hypothetical protein [Candidatus Woesearchaeota archaeon]